MGWAFTAFFIGYTGFIVGPPVIGVLSDQAGLAQTLALVVLALVAVTVLGRRAMNASYDSTKADAQLAVGESAS